MVRSLNTFPKLSSDNLGISLEECITLEVGEGDATTKFTVHKNVLCAASPFFQAACKPECMEPEEMVIKLPEDDPDAIRALVYWMYENKICMSSETYCRGDGTTNEEAMNSAWGLLTKLYVLGEKPQIRRLRNLAIHALLCLRRDKECTNFGVMEFVYDNTASSESPLRKLFVASARWEMNKPELIGSKERFPRDYFFDIAAQFFEDRGAREPEQTSEDDRFVYYDVDIPSPTARQCTDFHEHPKSIKPCSQLLDYIIYSPERARKSAFIRNCKTYSSVLTSSSPLPSLTNIP